jgi:hypothetical protein
MEAVTAISDGEFQRSARAEIIGPGPARLRRGPFSTFRFPGRPGPCSIFGRPFLQVRAKTYPIVGDASMK